MKDVDVSSAYWLAEALRLKESQWGPIEDTAEVRRVVAAGGDFTQRVLRRACYLGERLGWLLVQQQVLRWLRGCVLVLGVIFILLGLGMAAGALSRPHGSVNILLAWVALLGAPSLSLLLWLVSFWWQPHQEGRGFVVGHITMWLSQRFVRGPDQALLLRALLSLWGQQASLRWRFGLLNHILWLLALLAAAVMLVLLLTAKRYSFAWETTLLTPSHFVAWVQLVGWLPQQLGFAMPEMAVIAQSDGSTLLPMSAQVQWSQWLLGCLVVYGMLPRLMALLVCIFMLWRAQRRRPELGALPGITELKPRLQPQTEYVGVDAIAGEDQVPQAQVVQERPALLAPTAVIGIELSSDQVWPPFMLPDGWRDEGVVDNREQRHQLLTALVQHPVTHLVLCVDAEQTPDRGVVAWLAELATYADYCSIYLLNAKDNQHGEKPDRRESWYGRLKKAGFHAVYTQSESLLFELSSS